MPKLHTRQKRLLRMGSVKGRKRKPRSKSFKTEEAAKKYAQEKGIANYKLVDLKAAKSKHNKFKVVSE